MKTQTAMYCSISKTGFVYFYISVYKPFNLSTNKFFIPAYLWIMAGKLFISGAYFF